MTKEEIRGINWITILVLLIGILVLGLVLSRVRVEFEMDCDSGNIGIDYSGKWNQTRISSINNGTYPKYFPESIKLKDIDGLNCKIKGKVDMPWWIALIR